MSTSAPGADPSAPDEPAAEQPYRSGPVARALWALGIAAALAVAAWWVLLTVHGGHLFMVETPSMARTAPVGTLVVTEPVAPTDVHVGDIISFRPPGLERVYTHRVIEVVASGFRTKGDLNQAPDGWVVPGSRIVGKAAHLWTGVGWLLRMAPWLVLGGLVTVVWRRFVKPRNRAAVVIAGASLSFSLALIIVRPLVRAETIGFVPVGTDGVKISAVSTGLLPIRATALDGGFTDLVAGQLGWVTTHQTDSHGRFQLLPTINLSWWGWLLMGLFCALPLLASLCIRAEEIDGDEPGDGAGAADVAPGDTVSPPPQPAGLLARSGRGLAMVGSVVALAVCVAPTQSALTAKITNPTDTVASRTFFTCKDAMQYYQGTNRTAQLVVGYAGGDGTGVPGTTSLATKSTASLSLTATTQTTNVGCLTDWRARSQQALTLNGSTSKINLTGAPSQSLVDGDPQMSNRQAIQVWFRTTTTRGGVLGCLATASSTCSGRTLYMVNDGRVLWGVGSSSTISSPTALNDGRWHMAVGQLHTGTGMKLWIDGVLVASNAAVTSSDGNVVYPQFGYSAGALPSGFADLPTSAFFAGDLQFFATYGGWSATGGLQDADVKALYQSALP